MKAIVPMALVVNARKPIIMGLASAVVMMFLCSDALATPSGTSILQFNFVTVMTNTDVQPNASGNVNCKLDRRGTASNLQLKISLAKLDPNTPYQLIAYIDDDTNSTSVTQFTTGANGAFAVTYVQKANARSGEKLLPNALNPICSVRELDIVNGSGQTILQADLMDPDRLQYRLKRFMDNTGFIPAADDTPADDPTARHSVGHAADFPERGLPI
jgi:hypothetical protein